MVKLCEPLVQDAPTCDAGLGPRRLSVTYTCAYPCTPIRLNVHQTLMNPNPPFCLRAPNSRLTSPLPRLPAQHPSILAPTREVLVLVPLVIVVIAQAVPRRKALRLVLVHGCISPSLATSSEAPLWPIRLAVLLERRQTDGGERQSRKRKLVEAPFGEVEAVVEGVAGEPCQHGDGKATLSDSSGEHKGWWRKKGTDGTHMAPKAT